MEKVFGIDSSQHPIREASEESADGAAQLFSRVSNQQQGQDAAAVVSGRLQRDRHLSSPPPAAPRQE